MEVEGWQKKKSEEERRDEGVMVELASKAQWG